MLTCADEDRVAQLLTEQLPVQVHRGLRLTKRLVKAVTAIVGHLQHLIVGRDCTHNKGLKGCTLR